MSNPRTSGLEKNQTRRNIIKGGAILASVVAANVAAIKTSVAGQNGQGQNGQGGNGQGQNGNAQCLLRGTTIQTASGNRKIEDLAVGDLLPTVFGGQRPIQWIPRYHFKKSDPSNLG